MNILHFMTEESWRTIKPKVLCGKLVSDLKENELFTWLTRTFNTASNKTNEIQCSECKLALKKKNDNL